MGLLRPAAGAQFRNKEVIVVAGLLPFTLVMKSLRSGALLAVLAVAGSAVLPLPSASAVSPPEVSASVETSLRSAGYVVERGQVDFFRQSDCQQLASCYGNNPASPYGLFFLPPAPGEVQYPLATAFQRGPLRAAWKLRPDEAVLFVGNTPPESRYFSFRSYVFERQGKELFASLGDPVNHRTIAAGGQPFASPVATISTGDKALDQVLRNHLVSAGLSSTRINSDVMPPAKARFGLGSEGDTFTMLLRTGLFAEQGAGDRYLASSGASVYRIRPATPRTPTPAATPVARKGGTGSSENGLRTALDSVEASTRSQNSRYRLTAVPSAPIGRNGETCLSNYTTCLGDNPDALYTANVPVLLGPTESVIVYGVNHTRTQKATYTSLSLTTSDDKVGWGSVIDHQLVGSARAYLPTGHRDADTMFAYRIARQCNGAPYCYQVPAAIGVDQRITVVVRAYLEPGTNTAPHSSETLRARVLKINPEGPCRLRAC